MTHQQTQQCTPPQTEKVYGYTEIKRGGKKTKVVRGKGREGKFNGTGGIICPDSWHGGRLASKKEQAIKNRLKAKLEASKAQAKQ